MKTQQLFNGIILVGLLSCAPINTIEIDFCKMLARDQSNLNYGETDETKREENKKKRRQLFLENYKAIIQLTKDNGFPNIDFGNSPQDSCKFWAVTSTLIHMAQSKPEIFFSEETISIFKEEISKGNMESQDLTAAFRVSFITNEFCEELEKPIRKAINSWGMEAHIKREPKFKKCQLDSIPVTN